MCREAPEQPDDTCRRCRELLAQHEDDRGLADLLEQQHPSCQCEQHCIGVGSPGVVQDNEYVHRIIASPRDYDPVSRTIRVTPFGKVAENGLSVWRGNGPEEDIRRLLEDGLTRSASEPHREIFAICEVEAGEIRRMRSADDQRLFCIYDQTVCPVNPDEPPVSTHASVFLRVLAPPGTPHGKRMQKDYALQLREKFIAATIAAVEYRSGLCMPLNARAANGEFVRNGTARRP